MTKDTHPWLIVLLAAIVATTPLAIDMYLPALPVIATDLQAHIGGVQQSLSIFLVAYAAGMLLFGPLADMLGRRPLALFGLGGFTLSSLALAFSQQLEWFLLWRVAQAFCGAAATVVAPGLVRYLYQEHTAKGMSYVSMMMMLAPLLAPGIGSFILWLSDWRSIFWVLALYGALIGWLIWRYLPEIPRAADQPSVNLLSGYRTLFGHAGVRPLLLSMMCGSFAFFCFITAVPFVYIQYFGASEQAFSLLFGLNVMMLMLANWINSRWVVRLGSLRMLRMGVLLALVSGLLLVLVTSLQLGLWLTVLTVAPLMMGLTLAGTNSDALVLMQFPHNSGSATAVTGTLRFGSGALAGPLLALLFNGTPLPFAGLMLAGVLGVCLCQWWYWRRQRVGGVS